jgi:glycosyltransferase involved in cell wall biosynthesis
MMQRIDVVIPVYNEAHVLEASVRTLHAFLAAHVPQPCTVVIADNASTDGTLACARELAADSQCGFKAISAGLAHRLLPRVVDHGWFFDTELLLLAEHTGERIVQVPVDWVEDTDSRVDILATVMADLRGLQRVRRSFRTAGAAPAAAAHDDPDLRGGRRGGTGWAVGEVLSCSPTEARVVAGRPAPRRGPNGLGA